MILRPDLLTGVVLGLSAFTAVSAQQKLGPADHFDVEEEVRKLLGPNAGDVAFRPEYRSTADAIAHSPSPFAAPAPAPPRGLASAAHLAHAPSKAARKEFARGLNARQKRHYTDALRHFEAAVKLDPQYVEAHAALGASYAHESRLPETLEQFELGLTIEPNSSLLHFDRGWALLALGRASEAEPEAQRALEFEPSSPDAHYLAALAMLAQHKLNPETIAHLRAAADRYPQARQTLDELQKAADATSSPR